MRIHELEITDLRGIRHLLLAPAGQNLVIWGPNGSGKSAVVDAVEFLLQGRISRLAGAGTAGISLTAHGPHIDCAPATAEVRAVLEVPGAEGTFEVGRCLSAPNELRCPDEVRREIEVVLEAASTGQYVLARREILNFVTATGGDRAAAIQKLLRLEQLEEARKATVRAAHVAARTAKGKETDLATAYSTLALTLGLASYSEQDALTRVNEVRADLGGKPIDSLDPASVVCDLQRLAPAEKDVQALRLTELVPALKARWTDDAAVLREAAANLSRALTKLCEDPVLLDRLGRHDLIEAGIELVPEDGSCPLCEAPWSPGELHAKLSGDLASLSDVAAKRDAITEQSESLRGKAQSLGDALDEVIKLAIALELLPEGSSLAAWAAGLRMYADAVSGLSVQIDAHSPADAAAPAILNSEVDGLLLDGIFEKAKQLNPDATPEQKAGELLGRISENAKSVNTARAASARAGTLATRLTCLNESFTAASNEVLNELYESVRDRFVALYSSLHADDGEENFNAVLEREDAALRFEVDFFDRGMHPPHALHSEGHQDSMGVCLYLALAERVNQGLINLVVLDDVVMSVDSGHRKRLARLIADQFEGTQFIITTHERAWAQQLKSEGLVPSSGMIQFCGWSVEAGPRQNEADVWDKIEACLAEQDVRGASAYLRGWLEEFFAETCENLEAQVVYRGTGGYTLGDFLPAAWSRYGKLLRKAKSAANSWGHDDEMERLKETESVATQCYKATNAEGWAVNKGVHYDAWITLSAQDLTDVVAAFHDFCEVFVCSACGLPLRVTCVGMTEVGVQCRCRKVDWSLEPKQ